MVYESDFYTTRRPYRPSYSATMVQTFHHLPYIAHKKLVTVIHTPHPAIYHNTTDTQPIKIYSRVRPSVITAELQRIRNQIRPTSISYVSRYLNSKDNIIFDDEAREIRARADSILRRIHVYVPRPSASDFVEAIVPERLRSDDYIRRILTARKNTKEEKTDSWYGSPEHRHLGNGNLAAITYSAGKPISRRRPYYKVSDLRPADIQNDVNLLSFYAKHRHAAASIHPDTLNIEPEIMDVYSSESLHKCSIQNKEVVIKSNEQALSKSIVSEPEVIMNINHHDETYDEEIEPKLESFTGSRLEKISDIKLEIILPNKNECSVGESNTIDINYVRESKKNTQILNGGNNGIYPLKFPFMSGKIPEVNEINFENHVSSSDHHSMLHQSITSKNGKNFSTKSSEVDHQRVNDNPNVLQRKLDEDELRMQINELKRLAEERWKAEIEERVRLEEEARQLRLLEIDDQEQVEEFRRAEEEKILATRLHEKNVAEEERCAVEAENKKKKNLEANEITHDTRKQKEEEETVGEELSFDEILPVGNNFTITELKSDDECHCYHDFNDQDFEERPESPDADDDTQIEEEPDCEQIEHVENAHLCDEDHESFNNLCLNNIILESTIVSETS
ncbi:uncharacterized protein [Chelonus insularis]|uniref:uncharacterized protein isoform X2 n=1 Tax=Chelonus insularis TaxID=460826 RepID=UPI00158CCA17|nr:uncharacterized protein LOC118071093 isoform X2 [Chelonus insularis]